LHGYVYLSRFEKRKCFCYRTCLYVQLIVRRGQPLSQEPGWARQVSKRSIQQVEYVLQCRQPRDLLSRVCICVSRHVTGDVGRVSNRSTHTYMLRHDVSYVTSINISSLASSTYNNILLDFLQDSEPKPIPTTSISDPRFPLFWARSSCPSIKSPQVPTSRSRLVQMHVQVPNTQTDDIHLATVP